MSTVARQPARRNAGGRYTARSTWYDAIAQAHIARLEAMEAQADVAQLAQVVGNAVTAMPEAAPRIARAATLVQQRAVWPLSDGTWLAGSESDQERAYLVTRHPWTCDCADHTKHGTTLCKHILAVIMVIKLGNAYTPCYN